ncbi:MAG: LURP-one-related family protein [Clostridia bacterium]|nr:LURP-one-related family protein [Clostridia bacterium]MDE6758765.1 LURP-one-related family protein [Clostridia bacterium]MDE7078511.1 LURP-one-related family protein [Clostridia bacterium]
MLLKIKQKIMSLRGRYEILDENDQPAYRIRGKYTIPKSFEVSDAQDKIVAVMKSKVFDLLPTYILYIDGKEIGRVKKKFSFFKPKFALDCNGWQIEGNFLAWDYKIVDASGKLIATLSKEVFNIRDVYCMDIVNPDDALMVILIALSIDLEKQSD